MQIRPYLTFKGNCQEAIGLYARAFNTQTAELTRFSDMPQNPDNPMPPPGGLKDLVLQATLPLGDSFIRLCDCVGELNDPPSERTAIIVECTVEEVRHAFTVLSEEGAVGIPLQQTFFSPCHGVVHDRFGVMWIFMAVPENR